MANKGTFILHIGSLKEEMPRFIDCPRCGDQESCSWQGVAYAPVCPTCYASEEYQQQEKETSLQRKKEFGINDGLAVSQPTAVWQYKDQMLTTNNKGDIINQESVKNHKAKHERT